MDGTRADRVLNGHLNRPPFLDVILRDYPEVIVGLITGQFYISYILALSPDGAKNIIITTHYSYVKKKFVLREEDFTICQNIAKLFMQGTSPGRASAFQSESIQDLKDRISPYLAVEFAGRGEL